MELAELNFVPDKCHSQYKVLLGYKVSVCSANVLNSFAAMVDFN